MATKARDAEIIEKVVSSSNPINMAKIAADFNIPVSTLYRRVSNLIGQGLILRVRRGHYVPNPVMTRFHAKFDANTGLGSLVLPHLKTLHLTTELTTHFGVFEDDMVTYIAKVSLQNQAMFTKVYGQLEAYCSGVGKVLLAHLAPQVLGAYLESGPFPKVTANTIVDPNLIRRELK